MDAPGVIPPDLEPDAMRELFGAAFDCIVITEAGRIVFANEAFVELSGWQVDEMTGRSVLDFIAPECHAFVMEQIRLGHRRYEAIGLPRNGRRIDVEVVAANCQYQGRPARITAIRYITERKLAERSLQSSEARLRQLIERMTDMILVHRRGTVEFANPAALNYLGYANVEEIRGKAILDLVHPGDRPLMMDPSGPSIGVTTVRIVRRDDTAGVVELTSATVDDFDGEPAVLVLARDVAERKQMEARLVQADLLASMGMLAAGVAHEINNPLAYVTINVDAMTRMFGKLAANAPPSEAQLVKDLGELLGSTREGIGRVREIIRNFRVFARGGPSEPKPLELAQVLESTVSLAFSDIRHRARLVREYGKTPLVGADEPRLGQLFLNLLINALQAFEDRPRSDADEIHLSTRTDPDGWAVVEIRDTGVGIAPDVLGRVFQPFFSTKPVGVGTGLGLSICESIVLALGGTVSLESELGRGTTCRVRLPPLAGRDAGVARTPSPVPAAAASTAASASACGPDAVTGLPRRKILVVDDEPALLAALAQQLGTEHDVQCTSSGAEAIALVAAGEYDVVFCDLMMPTVSGVDVYEAVRGNDPAKVERFVFMTAGAFTPAAREFLRSLPNRTLEKPFTWSELYACLR